MNTTKLFKTPPNQIILVKLGKALFRYPHTVDIPQTAKTGEKVECNIYVINDDPTPIFPTTDVVHCRIVVIFAKDSEGKNVVDQVEGEFDAVKDWMGNNLTVLTLTFIMPPYDLFLGFFLYQAKEGQWVLVDSTAFLPIDNPDYPSIWEFWMLEFWGLKVWQWMLIGMGGLLAETIILSATRK